MDQVSAAHQAELVNVLRHTYSHVRADREAAERALHTTATGVPGFIVMLLKIAASDGDGAPDAPHVKQAAALALKNAARRNWDPKRHGGEQKISDSKAAIASGVYTVSEADKAIVRENILEALVRSQGTLTGIMAECLGQIAQVDFPHAWPGLVPQIVNNLNSGDIMRMQAVLTGLRTLTKKYEYKDKETDRAPLVQLIKAVFPLLINVLMTLVAQHNEIEAALMIKTILKIYWSASQYKLDKPLQAKSSFSKWFDMFIAIIQKPLPEAHEGSLPAGQPIDPEEREAWPWWKAKKWACHIVARIFSRYGNSKYVEDCMKNFAKMFVDSGAAAKGLSAIMTTLTLRKEGKYCSNRVVQISMGYIASAIELSKTYKLIKPHLRLLVCDIIFPVLYFNDADAALWEEDPEEYVRKSMSVIDDFVDPRASAANLLCDLVRYRPKDSLDITLGQIESILSTHAASVGKVSPQDLEQLNRVKNGALLAVCSLETELKKRKKYNKILINLIGQFVIPDFTSPCSHLRLRAVAVAGEFVDLDWDDASAAALAQASMRLLGDPELPVRAHAHRDFAPSLILRLITPAAASLSPSEAFYGTSSKPTCVS